MFKSLRDKIAISGITVLFIGVALLIFTFFSAYGLLTTDLSPISTQDLVQTFGESLGPLISAAIHIMYLGVMGWVSSLITIRGVTIMVNAPKTRMDSPKAPQQMSQIQKEKTEPEMMVIPLEEMEQQPKTQRKTKRSS